MTRRNRSADAIEPVALPIATVPKEQVLGRLALIKTAPIAERLEGRVASVKGKEPPFSRSYITSRLAYRVQELAYGGLKPETRARLEALGEQLDGGNVVSGASAPTAGRCRARG